jgi:hypothetical protein
VQCEEFESRLNDLLDERCPLFADGALADTVLADHAAVCSACASIARGYETLSEGVSSWERVEVSADLTSRVIKQWELAKAQSLASATDWDSAELPALRPVGVQRVVPAVANSGGRWNMSREVALAGALLATAAALLVISGVGRTPNANEETIIAAAPASGVAAETVARDTARKPATDKIASTNGVRPAPQFTLTTLPIVEQMTESYRPLLEETDRTVRRSLGLPLTTDSQMITSAAAMGLVTQPDPEGTEPTWDSLSPDQVVPVTNSAVRSVVALLRVLPGVEPVNQ